MTREELRDKMFMAGELERFKRTEMWELAFEMYKQKTRDHEVSFGCGNCFHKVKTWLTK